MADELAYFALGAGINLAIAVLIVRAIYYPVTHEKQYVFTFLAFNVVTYFVLGPLSSVELGIGVGFGLFAIFSVLRYRTAEIAIREMTYLFVVIALAVMNSILVTHGGLAQLLIANAIVICVLYVLEKEWGFHFQASKRVIYEKIELITPAERQRLIADLSERTGLAISRVEIGRIDFVRDTAELTIYYDERRTAAAGEAVSAMRLAPAQRRRYANQAPLEQPSDPTIS